MATERKSPHMTITVPGSLRRAMKNTVGVNWSQVATRAFQKAVFRRNYDTLADIGGCDSLGGAEYRRIFKAWKKAGFPENVADFILGQANGYPGATSG